MPKGIKYGGRKKGSKNKVNRPATEKAQELGVDPFEILLHFASGNWKALGYPEKTRSIVIQGKEVKVDVIDPEMRLNAAKEATHYILPKRKAVDENGKSEDIKIENVVYKCDFNDIDALHENI